MNRRDLLKMGVLATLTPTSVLASQPKLKPHIVCGPNIKFEQCGGYESHHVLQDLTDQSLPQNSTHIRWIRFPIQVDLIVVYNQLWEEKYSTYVPPRKYDESARLLRTVSAMKPEELFADAYEDLALGVGERGVNPTYSLRLDGYDFRLVCVSCDPCRC